MHAQQQHAQHIWDGQDKSLQIWAHLSAGCLPWTSITACCCCCCCPSCVDARLIGRPPPAPPPKGHWERPGLRAAAAVCMRAAVCCCALICSHSRRCKQHEQRVRLYWLHCSAHAREPATLSHFFCCNYVPSSCILAAVARRTAQLHRLTELAVS
jgi:hypothetical protein